MGKALLSKPGSTGDTEPLEPLTLTIQGAADYLGVSNSEMRLILSESAGTIPVFKLRGRGVDRVYRADIVAYVERQRRAAQAHILTATTAKLTAKSIVGRGERWVKGRAA